MHLNRDSPGLAVTPKWTMHGVANRLRTGGNPDRRLMGPGGLPPPTGSPQWRADLRSLHLLRWDSNLVISTRNRTASVVGRFICSSKQKQALNQFFFSSVMTNGKTSNLRKNKSFFLLFLFFKFQKDVIIVIAVSTLNSQTLFLAGNSMISIEAAVYNNNNTMLWN